jgi:predicted metal-dependent phosphoesterase TrpH
VAVDLHIHTTASDGTLEPAQVVRRAVDAGLETIAITDHDSVEGVAEAVLAALGEPIEVIAGVELSTQTAACPDAHVLGYFVEASSPLLLAALEDLRAARLQRAKSMIDALSGGGYAVTYDDVAALAGEGSVGRGHIARALVATGDVDSIETAFRTLIGRNGPYYVDKRMPGAIEVVELIHDAGGVAVLAHPGVNGDAALIELVEAGLDGLEAFHAEHTESQRQHYAALATQLGLVATGGSDFHGPATKNARLGAGNCPDAAVGELWARAVARRD